MDGARASGEKAAVRLLFAALLAWLTAQVGYNFWQAGVNGYGSGFGDGNHMPTPARLENVKDTFLLRSEDR